MKTLVSVIFILISFSAEARRFGESGPGNGTDYVKVLFAEAQFEILRRLEGLTVQHLQSMKISKDVHHFLELNLPRLQPQIRRINLRFQEAPCGDGSGATASICFFREVEDYVVISLSLNRLTTKTQAMAMLVHEAGHFLGEKDHSILDRVGVELVQALEAPTLLFADVESTEIVANVFLAKAECESGTSAAARALTARAESELQVQCSQRQIRCEDVQIQRLGEIHYRDGKGFDMRVTCRVRAVYARLR